MDELLLELLTRLERLGTEHEDLYDSEVRERMGEAVMQAFVRRKADYRIPEQFGMNSVEADAEVRRSLVAYIDGANAAAERFGLTSFHQRLAAFQNSNVRTSCSIAVDYDEFFGHTPPEWYDQAGNVLWDRVR